MAKNAHHDLSYDKHGKQVALRTGNQLRQLSAFVRAENGIELVGYSLKLRIV